MTANDLRALLEEMADGPAPPSTAAAELVFETGRRRYRRQRRIVTAAASAFAVVAMLGGGAVIAGWSPSVTNPPAATEAPGAADPRPGVDGPGRRIQWSGATDAGHLYLAYPDCPDTQCAQRTTTTLVGSDDGGRTWTVRVRGTAMSDWAVLASGALLAHSTSPDRDVVSVDGGRTWAELARASTPVSATPDGVGVICHGRDSTTACVLYAVDLAARRRAPLAAQPALTLDRQTEIVDVAGRLWVTGQDPATGRPAAAVSADRGRSWSVHAFGDPSDCARAACVPPRLATVDGQTVYATTPDAVYRRTATSGWQRLDASTPPGGAGNWSFVSRDGEHVVCERGEMAQDVAECRFWAVSAGSGAYRRIELDGLPSTVTPIRRTPDGWYYTHSYGDGSAFYGSADGTRWTPLTTR